MDQGRYAGLAGDHGKTDHQSEKDRAGRTAERYGGQRRTSLWIPGIIRRKSSGESVMIPFWTAFFIFGDFVRIQTKHEKSLQRESEKIL